MSLIEGMVQVRKRKTRKKEKKKSVCVKFGSYELLDEHPKSDREKSRLILQQQAVKCPAK